jgi:NADH dehydrogenase
VLAIPTWERKVRVLLVWASAVVFGRDIVSLLSVQNPRGAFLAGATPPGSFGALDGRRA